MLDQIPLPPLPAGREMLIVVAPLQVIGPPVLDDIVAPLSYRIFDLVQGIQHDSDAAPEQHDGPARMTGTNPDAIEAWAFDAVTFEHLLERLEPVRAGGAAVGRRALLGRHADELLAQGQRHGPARFAQFTSSGFKNVMPPMSPPSTAAVGFAQQMVRANLGAERIGWDQPRRRPGAAARGHDPRSTSCR